MPASPAASVPASRASPHWGRDAGASSVARLPNAFSRRWRLLASVRSSPLPSPDHGRAIINRDVKYHCRRAISSSTTSPRRHAHRHHIGGCDINRKARSTRRYVCWYGRRVALMPPFAACVALRRYLLHAARLGGHLAAAYAAATFARHAFPFHTTAMLHLGFAAGRHHYASWA